MFLGLPMFLKFNPMIEIPEDRDAEYLGNTDRWMWFLRLGLQIGGDSNSS